MKLFIRRTIVAIAAIPFLLLLLHAYMFFENQETYFESIVPDSDFEFVMVRMNKKTGEQVFKLPLHIGYMYGVQEHYQWLSPDEFKSARAYHKGIMAQQRLSGISGFDEDL